MTNKHRKSQTCPTEPPKEDAFCEEQRNRLPLLVRDSFCGENRPACRTSPESKFKFNDTCRSTAKRFERSAGRPYRDIRANDNGSYGTARTVRRHLGSVELRSTKRFSFTSLRRFDEKTFLNQKQRGHRGTNGCPLALAYLGLRLVKSRSASTNVRKEAHLPDYVYIYFLLGKLP